MLHDVTSYSGDTMIKVREVLTHAAGITGQTLTDTIAAMQNHGILFREHTPEGESVGDASDGDHTFNDLYDHRRALTTVLAAYAATHNASWRSKAHHPADGPMFDGYFIVGIELDTGTITYHYELKHWDDFAAVPERDHAPKWDGATPPDTVTRLVKLATSFTEVIQARAALG